MSEEYPVVGALIAVGLIRRRSDGRIRWPLFVAPLHVWLSPVHSVRFWGWFYVFRNAPGVVKWEEGRLLPRRWGFGFGGLVEFGDRG